MFNIYIRDPHIHCACLYLYPHEQKASFEYFYLHYIKTQHLAILWEGKRRAHLFLRKECFMKDTEKAKFLQETLGTRAMNRPNLAIT